MYVCTCNGVGEEALKKAVQDAWAQAAAGETPRSEDVLRAAGAEGHVCRPKRCADVIRSKIEEARPVDGTAPEPKTA